MYNKWSELCLHKTIYNNSWFATNPWRYKKTIAWWPCWMTKQKVLSSNMAATPLSFGSPGIGCKPSLTRLWSQTWVYLGVKTCEVFLCFVTIMHQSIPAVPIPPPHPLGNSGAFSQAFHPRGRALAFHPITPGHLTISLLSPYNICRFV